jgi:hypothetical protein
MREELFAPIVFDVNRNRYLYEEEGVVFFRFVPIQALDLKHARKLMGGYLKKN